MPAKAQKEMCLQLFILQALKAEGTPSRKEFLRLFIVSLYLISADKEQYDRQRLQPLLMVYFFPSPVDPGEIFRDRPGGGQNRQGC